MIVGAREAAGISQAELARRIGVPRSVMNVYEHGKREPGADVLLHILAATGNEMHVMPRRAPVDPARAGRILEQVIEFAEEFPYRPKPTNSYPPLIHRLS